MSEPIDEPVPKLPRGRGLKFSGPELFRIALTVIALIGVVVLTRPCANAVSGFVTSFDGSGTEKQMPKPGSVDTPTNMETLRPGMTDEEIKAAIERSKARAQQGGATTTPGSAGAATPGSAGAATPGGAGAATPGSATTESGSAANPLPGAPPADGSSAQQR